MHRSTFAGQQLIFGLLLCIRYNVGLFKWSFFSQIFEKMLFFLFFFSDVAKFDPVYDVEAIFPFLYKPLKASGNLFCCKLQFHGHHSYIRKDYQMLLAANIGRFIAST